MNSEEMKDILQLCRPDSIEDLNDPLIAEALEKTKQDSSLRDWFKSQQNVDAEIAAEFSRLKPPPDLKKSILKGMQEQFEQSGGAAETSSEEPHLSDQPLETSLNATAGKSSLIWFRPWIGIAAVFLFASILTIIMRREPTVNTAENRTPANDAAAQSTESMAGVPDIIRFLEQQLADFNSSKFDKRSEQINELQSHLALSGMPKPAEIPQNLETAPTIGCVVFDYHGTKMSMICFKNERVFHLITINKAHVDKAHLTNTISKNTEFFEHRETAFKVWSKDNQIYILCTKGTKEEIPKFI